jgi:diguanylate cyclase (GGDEF)-like protein/PAS domain S-box-containing protein
MDKKPVALITDDDATIRFLASEALEQAGFEVMAAGNGLEALDMFCHNRPDILLLDVRMPGMNGFDLCAEIRKLPEGKNVPILMITGSDDVDSIRRAYEAGATDFMSKPINWLILNQRVRYIFRASQNVEELRKSQASLSTAQRIARLGSWEMDIQTNEFRCSEEIRRIYGFKKSDSGREYQGLIERIHPSDRNRISHLIDRARYRGIPFQTDHRIRLPDSSERTVHHQLDPVINENGQVYLLVGTIQDITERKLKEFFEASRNQVLEMIIQNVNIKNILSHLVHVMEQQRHASLCLITSLRENRIHMEAASKLPENILKSLDGAAVGPSSECCSAAAVYTGEPVTLNNVSSNPRWRKYQELALRFHINSGYCLPIISGRGQILGTLAVFYPVVYNPYESDLSLVETVSKLAAVAMERTRLTEKLEHQARHDLLTGLPNRAALIEHLNLVIKQAQKRRQKAGVLYVDLDRFKHINDSLGHHIGDQMLKELTLRIGQNIQTGDMLARMSGDEFAYVLAGMENETAAASKAAWVFDLLSKPFQLENRSLYIGASMGISIYPDDGQDASVLLKNADTAMHFAKNKGGNRLEFFSSEMNQAVIERLEIENDLRKAIDRGQFELHYQPKYDFKNNKMTGFEALIRWNHPDLGRVPPVKFIPIAEESELIIPIGAWVLWEACRQNAEWERSGYGQFRIAVNVSVVQFIQSHFLDLVVNTLRDHNLPPDRLELEITESMVVNDMSLVRGRLSEFQKMGIMTTIDDFGTGYSSMSYLYELPINCLKIDRSFVQKLVGDDAASERSRKMIRSIVNLAKELNLTIVAEGPESPEQVEFLNEIGCDYAQGYYFSVPLSADEVRQELDKIKESETNSSAGILLAVEPPDKIRKNETVEA